MRVLIPLVAAASLLFSTRGLATAPDQRCTARVDVSGIPIIELPAFKGSDRLAVMLTGDGGWRRIDAKVTDTLRRDGVPVVGLLVSDFFRTRRTAEESACALERVMRTYQLRWRRQKVILIGYSRGADVLPFMASRLPADLRASVQLIALLGLEPTIDFKYNPPWTLAHFRKERQYPVQPELEKLRGHRILCFYGAKEKDSLCHVLDHSLAKSIGQPGGHHFAGTYEDIARTILREAR